MLLALGLNNTVSDTSQDDGYPSLMSICTRCARQYHAHALLDDSASATSFNVHPPTTPHALSAPHLLQPSQSTYGGPASGTSSAHVVSYPPTSQIPGHASQSSQSRAIGWHRPTAPLAPSQNARPPMGISSAPVPGVSHFPSTQSLQTSQFYPRQGAGTHERSEPSRKRPRVHSAGASVRFDRITQRHIRVIIDCLAVRSLYTTSFILYI